MIKIASSYTSLLTLGPHVVFFCPITVLILTTKKHLQEK